MKTFRRLLSLSFLSMAAVASAIAELPVVYCFKGPTAVSFSRLFEASSPVRAEALSSVDLLAARFASGEAKVGVLPANVAAKLASSGKKIAIAAVTGNGMLSILTTDPSIHAVADLKGKEVYVHGQGSTPDYVLRKIISASGLDPSKDITLRFSLSAPEIAQSLIALRIRTALIPEPFVTMALAGNPSLRKAFDVQEAWAAAGGSKVYPMTVLVVDTEWARANPAEWAQVRLACRDSVEWTVAHPGEAAVLVGEHHLGISQAAAEASIPKSAFIFVDGKAARASIEALFRVFLTYAPQAIGGKLPSDSFYLAADGK